MAAEASNKPNRYYGRLNEYTMTEVEKIFSNGRELPSVPENETPYFIVLVGSPGVGKTELAEKVLIEKKLGKNPDDFFNISLDGLVERFLPYRTGSHALYQKLKSRKNKNERPSNQNIMNYVSRLYLRTIMSKESNCSITHLIPDIYKKFEEKFYPDQPSASLTTKDFFPNLPPFSENKSPMCLNELLQKSIENAIQKRYSIIYDTTLNGTESKIMNNVLKPLEQYAGKHKYKIMVVILTPRDFDETYFDRKDSKNMNVFQNEKKMQNRITAQENAKNVKSRIQGRQEKMLRKQYVRAIPLNMVYSFIIENRDGFGKSLDFFTKMKPHPQDPNTQVTNYQMTPFKKNSKNKSKKNKSIEQKNYNSNDFEFYVLTNPNQPEEPVFRSVYPTKNHPTRKNHNNQNEKKNNK